MANELETGFTFLYSTLTGDATLMSYVNGVFRDIADAGTVPPYIIMSNQSSHDTNTANAWRIFNQGTYQIKVVGPRSLYTAKIAPAANRVDTLLARTSAAGVLVCYRESPFELGELVNGVAWTNLGGMYRILI